ncbi:hypothetical protein F2P81_025137 [Scophthalmus maximus]|uniref:Uncharacterized protein n=1 Tax=Scophthalmus maximus TaxID=52904 RepID=A0A6A4RTH4_SCOMX|nr:hypothetical protein F2P81_025137 [Scophthalmus maximus]
MSKEQFLLSDRGGAVLLSLVEYYLVSSSSQAVVLLSSVRESHHKNELQECQSSLRVLEAELQRANNKAYNTKHQLTQLSLKCSVGKEYQRLRDSDVQQRQKLEAANHRIAELENQLTKTEQLILDQKKLLEETKAQSSRCVALRTLTQKLQTEMLQLYSQIHLDLDSRARDACGRPNGGSLALPVAQSGLRPRPSSSSVGILNGAVEAFSTSPLHLPSCSSSPLSLSPIESPLAVGSYLEQRARQLFGPPNHSPEEEEGPEEPEDDEEEEPQEEDEEAQPEIPALGQEAEEANLPPGSPPSPGLAAFKPLAPPAGPAPPADLTLAVRQRRHELSIMDYDEMLPEY